MESRSKQQIEALVDACRLAAECGLVRYSSGNMSCRLDEHLLAVTVKGAWLGRAAPDEIAVCRIDDAACVNDKTPSVESGFHAAVYRARPDVNAVLHGQSPCATTIACGGAVDVDFRVIPEVPFYVGTPAVVEYASPGSPELADAITAALRQHDLAILQNHGQVAVGRGFDDVIQKAGFFELACEILVHGKDVRPLPPDGIEALRERAKKERSA